MLRALIFDVDGTLADTEELHRQAFNAAFQELGLWWDWSAHRYTELLRISGGKERMRHYVGTTTTDPVERSRLDGLVPRVHAAKTQIYKGLIENGNPPLRPGVARLLRSASDAGLKLAIASTTTRANVEALLRASLVKAGIAFDQIVCGDEVGAKKPAPDVYELALARLGLPAGTCIAFEDSENGLRAARAAGLATVVTPTRWTAHEDFCGADLRLYSLNELELPQLGRLLGRSHATA